ncbi:MAG: hypothetical protein ACIAS6_00515 [Phycisphaerales bacterium JB060]
MRVGLWRIVWVWALLGVAAGAYAQTPLSEQVSQRLNEIRAGVPNALADEELHAKTMGDLDALLAAIAVGGTRRDEGVLVDVAATRRIARLAAAAPAGERAEWWAYLTNGDGPGRTLAFALADSDEPGGVLRVLGELRQRFGDEKVARYPSLVTALCVVHDGEEPFSRRVNENRATSPGPAALFEYYTSNERQMLFGVRSVPPELLVFVVDAAASIDELEWALDKHRGDRAVGQRFFDISYDREHARSGRPKRVTEKGFTIQNISRYGGVCADQCHYAVTVGKAIGVPTAYVTGRGGEVGHAWVGYLEAKGRGAAWNFDVGRYEEYQGVRGDLLDPQTMETIGDDELGLLGKLTTVSERQRFAAAAWIDAAGALKAGVRPAPVDPPRRGAERAGREGVLDLAELALRQNPADRRGWALVRDAVTDPAMTMGERVRWSRVIIRLCEDANAEHFMVGVLGPMIASMDNALDRIAAWERVLDRVKTKKDLRARIRMTQAADAIERGDRHGAYLAYQDVIDTSLNDTRVSRHAVAGAVKMLEDAGKHREAAELLGGVLRRVDKPGAAAVFSSSSNYNAIRAMAQAYSAKHGVAVAGL